MVSLLVAGVTVGHSCTKAIMVPSKLVPGKMTPILLAATSRSHNELERLYKQEHFWKIRSGWTNVETFCVSPVGEKCYSSALQD